MRISGAQWVVAGTTLLVLLTSALVVRAALAQHAREESAPGRAAEAPVVEVAPQAGDLDVARAVGSLAVLRDWDRGRAAAWAAGDPAALRRLYTPRSAAGRADVAMLRRWTARGLRVEGMAMQVSAIELRRRTSRRLVLVVTDRLVGAVAVGDGRRVDLPRDLPTTRRLVLVRPGRAWLLASAVEVSR